MRKRTKIILYVVLAAIVIFFAADFAAERLMKRGVDNYFGLNQNSEILLVGHSHLMLSVDKQRMESELGRKVSKYCREGVNAADRDVMVRHFLRSGHADSLRVVLYGVDLYTFTGEGLSKNSYQLFYPFIDSPDVDTYLRKEATPLNYWLHKIVRTSRYNSDAIKNSAIRGWQNNWDNYKTNVIDYKKYAASIAKSTPQPIEMNDTIMAALKHTVKTLTDRGIRVVLVNTPTIDLLNRSQGDRYRDITYWYRNFAASDSLVEFWDFNPAYSSNHTIFSDPIHLNTRGQQLITTELISRLRNLH